MDHLILSSGNHIYIINEGITGILLDIRLIHYKLINVNERHEIIKLNKYNKNCIIR